MAKPLDLGSAAAANLDEIDAKAAARPAEPAPTGTALEAGLRGAASSLTLGASEFLAGHNPALWLARKAQESAADQAQTAAVEAARSGDPDARIAAESELSRQRGRLSEIKAQEEGFNAQSRARTAALMESHGTANVLGNVAGMLLPVSPVAQIGRLAARAPGLLGKAAQFTAEGAAMGLQSGLEEAGQGEVSGTQIAKRALTGAALNGALGLGGLGFTQLLGKAFKGGASKLLGVGEDAAAKAEELGAVGKKLASLDAIAAADTTGVIGARLAEVRAAQAKGLLRAADDAALTGNTAALSEAEAAAVKSRSILKETLKREAGWTDADPATLLDRFDAAKASLASTQAGIQAKAAEWLKTGMDKYAPYVGGAIGLSGQGAHGDDDIMGGAVGMVGKVLLGMATASAAGGIAARLGGRLSGAAAPMLAGVPGFAEGLAAPVVSAAGRVATTTGMRVLTGDEFEAAKRHVDGLNLAAPEIGRATAGALVDSGWSPLAAQNAADRRVASIGLLSQKAAAGDRIGFSRVLYALSSPASWTKEARGGLLTPEHIEAYRTLAPTVAANISQAAQGILSDKTQSRGLKPRARRMLELFAQTSGPRIGTIQQAAFGPQQDQQATQATNVRSQSQPTSSQATEERRSR